MTAEVTNSLPNCASNESATEGNRAFSGRAGLKPLPIRRGGKADPASLPRDFATGIPLLTHAETDVQHTMNALRAELADAPMSRLCCPNPAFGTVIVSLIEPVGEAC